jgi:uncharacterized membrane protein
LQDHEADVTIVANILIYFVFIGCGLLGSIALALMPFTHETTAAHLPVVTSSHIDSALR